jgi:LCP family protein required for cell wall assembly
VLSTGHYALAQFTRLGLDAIGGVGAGDTSDVGTGAVDDTEIPDAPSEDPSVPPTSAGATDVPSEAPTATATQAPPWDGRERLNILLIGADRRENSATYLTDTLIVASIDPQTRQVSMFSLPRDMSNVPLPPDWAAARRYGGSYPSKINTLYTLARRSPSLFPGNDAQRGYIAVKGALSELYGIDIKYYVAVDFRGFLTVIDALGGVAIDVQNPVTDYHYPSDDGRGAIKLYIPPGIQYMDGPTALAYARARHNSDDFTRAHRQQRVILSVRQQTDLSTLLAPGRLDALVRAFKNTVRTDVPPEDFPKLIGLMQDIDLTQLRSLVFAEPTFATECYPCPPSGLYVLQPNIPAIREAVQRAFNFDPVVAERVQRISEEQPRIRVINGSGVDGRVTEVSRFLNAYGAVTNNGGLRTRPDPRPTTVTVFNGAEATIPETIKLLEETFGVSVQLAENASTTDQVEIMVGSELPPLEPPG